MNNQLAVFRKSILTICPVLNEEEILFLENASTQATFRAKENFIDKGEIQTHIGFVISGLLRGYYINDSGDLITIRFVKEHQYATDYAALLQSSPSQYYFQCLEKTIILKIPIIRLQEGYDRFKGIERFGRLITERIHNIQQKRIESFLFQNAEQRYVDFVNNNAELLQRISISDLSTFLGIKRQSLSRIRKNISKQ